MNARDRLIDLERWAERPALWSDGAWTSYAALEALARRWSGALAGLGVTPGGTVAMVAVPARRTVAAMLGAYRLGACWVPINPRYRTAEVDHVVADSGAVVVPDHLALPDDGPDPVAVADDAAALLIYTSGTTGKSKGVELSYRAIVDGIGALTELWRWSEQDVLSLQLPIFHVHGLCIGVHGALLHGMPMLLHPRFDAATVVADVRDRGATVFMGVPTMYVALLEHLDVAPEDGKALAAGRLFTAGSAALPAADLLRFEGHTGHRILERYGMTETLITLSNPYDGERRPGSVGLPLPGVTARVVDDDGTEVGDGEVGELQVQTPGMMTGYRGRPDETAAAFDGPWFRTGDVVRRAGDGYFEVVGRKSVDIIKSGGFKLGAREIEDVLAAHPAVDAVAVFGVPDPRWGERVAAAVVLRSPLPDALGVLQQHCIAALADYKKPRQVLVVDELPRNAMGKVLKAQLRDRARADEKTPPPTSG